MSLPSTSTVHKRTRSVCPQTPIIKNQFEEGEDGSARCKLCKTVLKSSKTSNLKRHLETIHVEEYGAIFEEPPPTPRKMRKIQIEMDEALFYESCVKMTTVAGMPLNVFEAPGVQDVFSRIESGLGINHVNRNNVTGNIFCQFC